jgi:aminoglycoside phosphotransferase (APT) family kinase protein
MHTIDVRVALPSQRERLRDKIERAKGLSSDLREAQLEALERMPEGDRLCHGDFHPGNVIITKQGPIVIDWIDATRGNPLADVARTSVILLGSEASRRRNRLWKAVAEWYHRLYLKRYLELLGKQREEYKTWYPIVAAARMSEGIVELEEWLRGEAETGLRGG